MDFVKVLVEAKRSQQQPLGHLFLITWITVHFRQKVGRRRKKTQLFPPSGNNKKNIHQKIIFFTNGGNKKK